MVIAEAKHAEEVRAAEDDASTRLDDAHEFRDEGLGFLNVLEDVERAGAGEVAVGEGELASVVKLAAVGELSGAGDVGFGDIDAMRLEAGLGQLRDDLAHAAADIEGACAGAGGAEGIGGFGVERGVPVGEVLGVGFVLFVVGVVLGHFLKSVVSSQWPVAGGH